jgi:hypothetical protein
VTFDYFGGAPWYLHASAPAVFGDRAKTCLGAVETIVSRVFLLMALLACARLESARPRATRGVLALGGLAALTWHAWPGYIAIPVALALAGSRAMVRAPFAAPVVAVVAALAFQRPGTPRGSLAARPSAMQD